MFVCLNGQFVPEDEALISVFDRGFLYGDGLFETMRVRNGKPFRWGQHIERLERGAEFLKIRLPHEAEHFRNLAEDLVAINEMPDALLRLTVSRGVGIRGYSPKGADQPVSVLTVHPAPPVTDGPTAQWRLVTAPFHLPANEPLAQFKTCNKLAQVLARGDADAAGADEALLLNTLGDVVEGASSNLFWIESGAVCTPPLASGILAGVTRAVVMELCEGLGMGLKEKAIKSEGLLHAEGVFLSLSSVGIAEAGELDGQPLRKSELTARLAKLYAETLERETSQ